MWNVSPSLHCDRLPRVGCAGMVSSKQAVYSRPPSVPPHGEHAADNGAAPVVRLVVGNDLYLTVPLIAGQAGKPLIINTCGGRLAHPGRFVLS